MKVPGANIDQRRRFSPRPPDRRRRRGDTPTPLPRARPETAPRQARVRGSLLLPKPGDGRAGVPLRTTLRLKPAKKMMDTVPAPARPAEQFTPRLLGQHLPVTPSPRPSGRDERA